MNILIIPRFFHFEMDDRVQLIELKNQKFCGQFLKFDATYRHLMRAGCDFIYFLVSVLILSLS